MPHRTASTPEDPNAAKRRAFARNRRVPRPDDDDRPAQASRRPVGEEEMARRELYEARRRVLITETHPLDDESVEVLDGAQFFAALEEFRRSAKVNSPRSRTKAYDEPVSFAIGARTYGTKNDVFCFARYELLKLSNEEVVLITDGLRLYFRRCGKVPAVKWVLDRRQPEGGGSGKSARYRQLGHGPSRSE